MKLGVYVTMLITMMVFLEFVGVPTGLSATLNNFGININSNTATLVNADLGNSSFWTDIFGNTGWLIVILGGGAIIIGFFAKSYDPSLIILPIITTTALLLISTFWTIIKYTQNLGQDWMTNLIATIFIALGVGFVWSCVDYFAGR